MAERNKCFLKGIQLTYLRPLSQEEFNSSLKLSV